MSRPSRIAVGGIDLLENNTFVITSTKLTGPCGFILLSGDVPLTYAFSAANVPGRIISATEADSAHV